MLVNADALLDKVDGLRHWIGETPGACNGGRAMATDDPDRLGWDVIRSHLLEDGIFVFRHLPADRVNEVDAKVSEWGFTLHSWRIFHGTSEAIRTARRSLTAPAGYRIVAEVEPKSDTVSEAMTFMRKFGIKPFSCRTLAGLWGPSVLVTARDAEGALQATSFGHFCFNRHSAWQGTAWCGLVAVEDAARGAGLGRTVNDAAIDVMIRQHGADAVVEYAAEDNVPSRRMIEGSGLSLRDDIRTCAATRGAKYTR